MKKHLIWLAVLSFALLVMLAACSKDSTSSGLTEGNPNDPTYLQARAASEEMVDTVLGEIDDAIAMREFDGSGPVPARPADTLFMTMYEDYWWEFRLESGGGNGSLAASDSFRFEISDDEYQDLPDSTTNAYEYRSKFEIANESGDTSATAFANETLRLEGLTEELLTINGSSAQEVAITMGSAEASMNNSGSLEDIVFIMADLDDEIEDHPQSGVLTLSAAINSSQMVGGLPALNFEWTLTVTFSETGYHARLESGDNYWEWDREWEGPA